MVGCFGLAEDHGNAYRFPAARLVERVPRLDVFAVLRAGGLAEGARLAVEIGTGGGRPAVRAVGLWRRGAALLIGDQAVRVVWDAPMPGVDRPWWRCPSCSRRCRFIFLRGQAVACRQCFGLQHASLHLRRQTPQVGRIERLRRKLGDCDLAPFSPLPARPRRGRTRAFHDALVSRILSEESALLGHLRGVASDLRRRIRVRKANGEW